LSMPHYKPRLKKLRYTLLMMSAVWLVFLFIP